MRKEWGKDIPVIKNDIERLSTGMDSQKVRMKKHHINIRLLNRVLKSL